MREGVITISESNFSTNGEGFVNGQKFISVDFDGHNEGSGSPCLNEEEAQQEIKKLIERHRAIYTIKIIDERIKQRTLF